MKHKSRNRPDQVQAMRHGTEKLKRRCQDHVQVRVQILCQGLSQQGQVGIETFHNIKGPCGDRKQMSSEVIDPRLDVILHDFSM